MQVYFAVFTIILTKNCLHDVEKADFEDKYFESLHGKGSFFGQKLFWGTPEIGQNLHLLFIFVAHLCNGIR